MARRRMDSEREFIDNGAILSSSSVSNGTSASASVAGACESCDSYGWATCGLCPNCKWRSEKCMHKCTSCCAYAQGCPVDYCICNGKINVFEDMWKGCGSQRGTKTYYFQIRVPHGPDHANDSFIAMEFERSLDDPQLIIHFNQEWTIQTTRQMTGCRQQNNGGHHPHAGGMLLEQTSASNQTHEESVSPEFSESHGQSLAEASQGQSRGGLQAIVCDWKKTLKWVAMPASHTEKPTTEVIHLADVEYIRVFKEQLAKARMGVTTLEIKRHGSGEPLKIYGGLYIPPFAFEYAMDAFWPAGTADVPPPKDDGSGVYVSEPEVEYNKGGGGWLWVGPSRLPVQHAHYRVSKMFEFLEAHLKDDRNTVPNQHGGAVVGALFGGFFAGQIGAMTGAVGAGILTASLGPVAIPLVFVGFFGGFALPFGSIFWNVKKNTEADTQRELKLLASEKIFEKMRCHETFQHCGGVAIAPEHGRCPY